jgi:hypothetical protein
MNKDRISHLHLRLDSGPTADPDSRDLAEFMMLFRGVYVAGLRLDNPGCTVADLTALLAKMTSAEIAELFSHAPSPDALRTRSITHESPLEIVLYGVAVPLVLAVTLLGGEFNLGGPKGITAKLKCGLLEAIARLKQHFTPRARTTVGYGGQDRRIKLTKDEFKEVMRRDPRTRARGGFQRFLIGLQFRVDRTTREITLSPSDIDMILKHGSTPKKGGFQWSIRKIFESHFDWT